MASYHQVSARRVPPLAVTGGVLVASVIAYLAIHAAGLTLTAPQSATTVTARTPVATSDNPLSQVLLALLVVVAATRLMGVVFRYFHQPPVVGEVLAGILLGPSLLGHVSPGLSAYIFPPAVVPALGVVAQIGILLFMFVVGLELNTELLREKSQATVVISQASIVIPFLLGSALALGLYPLLSTREVSFTAFSLFLGISVSVTAFPVLARILTDRRMHTTSLGTLALGCAAANDVAAWCLLALVIGVIQSRLNGVAATIGLTLLYSGAMLVVVRPLARRWVEKWEGTQGNGQTLMGVITLGLLLSSLATEWIGIHSLFGAFLFGAIIPHDSLLARTLTHKLEDLVVVMLLPAFFVLTGLRTQIALIHGADWLTCGAILLVACAGKFGGTAVAGRMSGMSWHDASALGILMNTRGLMELVVLNIGLELGVISPKLFAMLVLMAVVTTFATTPVLDLLNAWARRGSPAGREAEPPISVP